MFWDGKMIRNSGFINVIKPTGMTSADVVFAVKKKLKVKKIGHLGTLDPAATGVLPIAIGKATKFFDYFLNKEKIYIARVKFGIETDTLDSFGKIIEIDNTSVSASEIQDILPKFIGKINQIPPKYSAIKIDGKRACDLARENIEFEIKSKQIEIYDLKLLRQESDNEFLFYVHCSAGTYIRTLFSDIAKKLNAISTTTAILRQKSGKFDTSTAVILEEINEDSIVSILKPFEDIQKIEVNDIVAKKLLNGVKISKKEISQPLKSEFFAVFNNTLIGLYKVSEESIEPLVFLNEVIYD